jgi:hypothetical protein
MPTRSTGIAFPATGNAIDETLELGVGYAQTDDDQQSFDLSLDADAGLADRLCVRARLPKRSRARTFEAGPPSTARSPGL